MTANVEGGLVLEVLRKLHEIERQVLQKSGYPHSLSGLNAHLQGLVVGDFPEAKESYKILNDNGRPGLALALWLEIAENQTWEFFSHDVRDKLFDMFEFPQAVPWQKCMIVYIPPSQSFSRIIECINRRVSIGVIPAFTNCQMPMEFDNSESRLYILENRTRPTRGTMGVPLEELRKRQKTWLPFDAYLLASAQRYLVSGMPVFDVAGVNGTRTCFPADPYHYDGACEYSFFNICCGSPAVAKPSITGAREAIRVPLRKR